MEMDESDLPSTSQRILENIPQSQTDEFKPRANSPDSLIFDLGTMSDNEESAPPATDVYDLLVFNEVYLELIAKMIAKVDTAVETNRELQQTIKNRLASRKLLDNQAKPTNVSLQCYPPYFKNMDGFGPHMNAEARTIAEICSVNPLMGEDRMWRPDELAVLRDSVRESLLHNKILPLVTRKELIADKLSSAGAETSATTKEEWRGQIQQLNRRIFYYKDRPESEVFVGSSYEDVDWAKISATDFRGARSITQLRMKWVNEMSPRFSHQPWTAEEDSALSQMTQRPWINWDAVAEQLGTSRPPFHCFQRFLYLQQQEKGRRPWILSEDEKLMSLVQTLKVGDEINWKKVASYIPNRTKNQCKHRYLRSLDASLKHGRWTVTEDMQLLMAINKYGPLDWHRVCLNVPNRSAIQCRDRWINVLDLKRRNKPWLWEEHIRLLFGIRIWGRSNYAKIALLLPGRNNADVKGRIFVLVRYKILCYEAELNNTDVPPYKLTMPNFGYFKDRRDLVLSKFCQFFKENEGDFADDESCNQQKLVERMGLGSYVTSSNGNLLDYSISKMEKATEFGRVISKAGRWQKLQKNPNEYGSEELREEIQNLDQERRQQLIEFLRESDVRYSEEMQQEEEHEKAAETSDDLDIMTTFYDSIITAERTQFLKEQLEEILPVTDEDVVRHNSNKQRPPKLIVEKKQRDTDEIGKRSEPKAKKRKTMTFFDHLPPKRNTMKTRLLEEVERKLTDVSQEERRACILQNLCRFIRNCDDVATADQYNREKLKTAGLPSIERYIKERLALNLDQSGSPRLFADLKGEEFSLNYALKQLVPPSSATINGAILYQKSIKLSLMKNAAKFCTSNPEKLIVNLPPNEKDTPEYAVLKTIMYRLFFLPLLMHRATQ